MKTIVSDSKLAALLRISPERLDELSLYKACGTLANNGIEHASEKNLPDDSRVLLQARRVLKRQGPAHAQELLRQNRKKIKRPLHRGDFKAIEGQILGRLGQHELAARRMNQASTLFVEANDLHRLLRSRINEGIYNDSLDSFLGGELAALEQACARENLHDLVANIQKGRAVCLMEAGRISEALIEATSSVERYLLDGCHEDRNVALCLRGILENWMGNAHQARRTLAQVHQEDGKVRSYRKALIDLIEGRIPALEEGHPLSRVTWKATPAREDSVTGRIVSRLSAGPASRDELIELVWGKNAISPSYNSRLFSALNSLRKKQKLTIRFDGSRYHLA